MSPGPLQRLAARGGPDQRVDDLGLHGLAHPGGGWPLAGRRPPPTGSPGELRRLGAVHAQERYVFDGKYVTAAGVSAGIDMALALAGRIAGDEEAALQLMIEYDPQPPYDSGSPATAKPEIVASLRATSRFAQPA